MPPQMAWAESQAEGPRANPRRSGGAPGTCRIALSGAPVENKVPELRSHFEFNLDGGPPCGASRCRRRPRSETTQKRRRLEDQGTKAALSPCRGGRQKKFKNFPQTNHVALGLAQVPATGPARAWLAARGVHERATTRLGDLVARPSTGTTCATYAACTSRARGAPRFFLRATSRQRCAPGEKKRKKIVDASRIPASPS